MEMRHVFGETLAELGRGDQRVVVIDADLNTSTGTVAFKEQHPNRFLQMGIAEQNMFGWAAGLAAMGLIPFPCTFASFAATRAADQIRVSIAYTGLNVKIAGSYPGLFGDTGGATHSMLEDLAIMRAMPNMRVLAPCDARELRQVMHACLQTEGPVYFRVIKPEVPDLLGPDYQFNWQPVQIRKGRDIALVGTGYMTHACMQAAQLLGEEGVDAAVIHIPSLKPLPAEPLLDMIGTCKGVVTAENHSIIGGLGSAVAEILSERHPRPLRRIGTKDTFLKSGTLEELAAKYGLEATDIVQATEEVLQ